MVAFLEAEAGQAGERRDEARESLRQDAIAPLNVENLPDHAEKVKWNADVAERMGLADLSEALRQRRGTAQGFEQGPIEAQRLVELPMQKAYGRFGTSPRLVEQELTYANIEKHMRRMGEKNFFALPEERQDSIKAMAADGAKREVASIVGVQQQRGNAVVDLDPEQSVQDIRDGNTMMGMFSGQYLGSKIEGAIRGVDEDETLYSKVMSPFTAMFTAGGRSVQPQDERPVLGMQKEGKLSWFLRLAPSTAVGAWLFNDGPMEWGGEDHIEKIYAGGYDVTQEMHKFGDMYAAATPWVDSKLATKAAGLGMVFPIIMLEPDATALVAGPIGKAVKFGAKMARPSKLLLNTVLRPELAKWTKALAKAGGEVDEIEFLTDFESSLNLREWSPRWLMWRAVKGELFTRLQADAIPVWDAKASSGLGVIQRAAASLIDKRKAAGEELAGAGKAAQAAQRLAKAGEKEVGELAAEVSKEESTKAMLDQLQILLGRRDDALTALEKVATADGTTLGAALRSKDGIRALQGLIDAKPAYDDTISAIRDAIGAARKVTPAARAGVSVRKVGDDYLDFGSRANADRYSSMLESVTNYRKQYAAMAPELAVGGAAKALADINQVAGEALTLVSQALGKSVDSIPGDLRRLIGNAKTNVALAKQMMAEGSKDLREVGADALSAIGDVASARAFYEASVGAAKVGKRTSEHLRDILGRYEQGAASLASVIGTKSAEAVPAVFKGSVTDVLGKAGDIEPVEFLSKLGAKYGDEAAEFAVSSIPGMSYLLKGGPVGRKQMNGLFRYEAAAHSFVERARLAQFAPVKAVITSTGEVPRWGRHFTPEGFLASTLKMTSTVEKIVNPILSRGLASSPKLIREVYRRTFERFQTYEMEMGAAIHAANKAGTSPFDAAMEYMTTPGRWMVAGSATAANRDVLVPANKMLYYLKAVSKAGDDSWFNDLAVQGFARAALPSTQRGEVGAREAARIVRELAEDATDGKAFLEGIQQAIEAVTKKEELSTDAAQVTTRFVTRATLWAAVQHDAMWDLMRAQGGGMGADTARAMNFMLDARKAKTLGKALDPAAGDEVSRLLSTYNLPLTQEVSTGLAKGLSTFVGGIREKNALMKMAVVEGKGVWVPAHIKAALEGIPRVLVKDIAQFDQPANPLTRGLGKLMRLWRISVVNGYFFPRVAHFTNTFMGDMSQIVASVGWRPALRISAQTSVAYIPFVGPKLQDKLAGHTVGKSMISGLMNPELSRVMNAGTDIIETADGPISSRRLLQESHEDGMLDSISTMDLIEVTRRTPQTRWRKMLNGDPPPWIVSSAKFLESVQHRIRVQTYLEARTGKLTGTPLARREAADLVRETLFDWRLGVPRWESETIGKLFVFWTYKRAMLRQLGAAMTESVTAPGHDYLWKALSGNTKLNRMRQTGQMLSAVPEAIYWDGDEDLLGEDEQILAYGRRVLPWWVDAQPLLMNRELDGARKGWYSDVAGRNVTMESVVLPSLTTLDAIASLTLMANTSMATTVMLAEKAGMQPRLTTADAAEIWERNVDAIGETMAPGAGEFFTNGLRPFFGESRRKSSRGVPVPQATAVMLKRLGWEEFIGTYTDESGRTRYHADANALQIVAQLVAISPPATDLTRNWAVFDNPGWQADLESGVIESFARLTGLAKFSPHTPAEGREWEVLGQERDLKNAVKSARAQGGSR